MASVRALQRQRAPHRIGLGVSRRDRLEVLLGLGARDMGPMSA
jgi:hypothetical protein